MYIHAILNDRGVDVYQAQMVLHLDGPLDADLLRRCAQTLLRRHTNLRACFRQRRDGEPIQVIPHDVTLPWQDVDLSDDPDPADRLADLLAKDRERRLNLAVPPLLRASLVCLAVDRWCLVLTSHHIIFDGWSSSILVKELLTLYGAGGDPGQLPAVTPYRAYLAWIAARDPAADENAWRPVLSGLAGPCLVAPVDRARAALPPVQVKFALPDGTAAALTGARAGGLTMNTLVQGAWALLLWQLLDRTDVVFGATVSGRPPELPGVDAMVGLFINTIPVRVRVHPQESAGTVLRRLQEQQAALSGHHHLRLSRLSRLAGVPELFDTLVVFDNYPSESRGGRPAGPVRVTRIDGHDAAHFPLRLVAGHHGTDLDFLLEYRSDLFTARAVRLIGDRLAALLAAIVGAPDRPLSELASFTAAERLLAIGDRPPPPAARPPLRSPLSPREEILAGLFAEILGVDRVGPDDSFFELGGQSLSAVRLLSQIRLSLGVELPIRSIFRSPSVRGLATELGAAAAARPAVRPANRPERPPLSFAQRRLWLISQLEDTGPLYNIPIALMLTGDLDATALQAAVGDIVTRHEALRTVFPEVDGEPYQRLWPAERSRPDLPVTVIDQSALGDALHATGRYAFDLTAEPPLQARLWRTAPDRHALLLVVHHIAADGWSIAPLLRDLSVAYAARRAGQEPGWTPLDVQYVDYSSWQRELLSAEEGQDIGAGHLAYWRDALAELPDELNLPLDRPRPSVPSYRGDTVRVRIDAQTHSGLTALTRATRSTVFMVLQAGLAALLCRMGAGTDIPLGTATAGRGDAALHDLVGFFVNTVVLRTDVSGDPTFRELVARVREADLAAYDRLELPFERLVEVLNPPRSLARHPLFQVMLVLQNNEQPVPDMPGLRVAAMQFGTGMARFDLSLSLHEEYGNDGTPAGLTGILEYSADLFDRSTAQAFGGRLTRLLAAASHQPDQHVASLDILDPAERELVLRTHNDTGPVVPPATFPDLFEAQVRRTPDAPAVSCAERPLTYAEVNARASRIAHQLIGRGVGPEQIVALAIPPSIEFVAAALGVLKAGGAFLPVDLDYPRERIATMLAVAKAQLVLTTADADGDITGYGAPTVPVSSVEIEGPIGNPADADRLSALTVDCPAYAIFTSGSTGRPKGVVVTHRGFAGLVDNQRRSYDAGPGSRILQYVSPSFDVSVAELCLALLTGGCLVIPPRRVAGAELAEALRQLRITHIHIPPSVLATVPRVPLADLRALITGAEECPADLVEFWSRDRLLVNAYGPSEATVDVTFATARSVSGRVPIGRPIPTARVYLLDAALRPLPPGAPGEIFIASDGLARGYLRDPAGTAMRFVADPFGAAGSRMYRTGDVARWRSDGQLDFLGREDDQIKLRGFRIETGEIEAVLRGHPAVDAVAVVLREDTPGDKRLVAYTVTAGGAVDVASLRDRVAAALPSYMMPSAFVDVDELPVGPNGKLDRRRLPAPAYVAAAGGPPPRSAREEVMCQLFGETLGAEIGVNDDFFTAGGHSLLAARLVSRVRATLGGELTLRSVFVAPTPARLLAVLDGAPEAGGGFDVLLPLRPHGDRYPLFCVHPLGGTAWRYASLLRHLDAAQPVYGLQAQGLDGQRPLPESVPEMVGTYAEWMRKVQPSGPYHLLGWSMGGNLAHALAGHLQQQDDEVALLAILDAYPVPAERRADTNEATILTTMLGEFTKVYGPIDGPPPVDMAHLRAGIVELLGRSSSELRHFDPAQRSIILDIMINTGHRAAWYTPADFAGDMVLVVAARSRQDWATPQSWRPLVRGRIDVHEVDSLHATMLDPGPAADIARLLSTRISQRKE